MSGPRWFHLKIISTFLKRINNGSTQFLDKTEEEIYQIIWEQIKKINKTFPKYKYIQKLILTDEELIKTTTKNVKRNEEMKKILN